ncbi:MAG: protein kinase [Pseudomonadota bacterium]
MDRTTREAAIAIFSEVLDIPTDERDAFITTRSAGNAELANEVYALLRASTGADTYFSDLANRFGAAIKDGRDKPSICDIDQVGLVIGPYTLRKRIGRGGSSSVWLAERTDGQFEGSVAIKLLHSDSALANALANDGGEAQHLARLSHPNIARLLDAGTDSAGQQYLVIELIDGVPIDRYCDNASLSVAERIRLYLDVINAVAHAHAQLVVHRDIKPSNVLVTANGSVRLLDFGIATLLEADSSTVEARAALTPEYAAPEQLRAEPVSTATDIYALGLLLYRLLAGRGPRDPDVTNSYAQLVAVSTEYPPKASIRATASEYTGTTERALRDTLAGDIDAILDKALAPSAADRYQSAIELAADLKYYLDQKPVSVVPATLGYRTAKFVARNRGSVFTAVLTVLLLIGAAAFSTWQLINAREQRDFAVYQQQRAATSSELLDRLLNDGDVANDNVSVAEVFRRSAATLDRQTPVDQRYAGQIYFDLARGFESLKMRSHELQYLERARLSAVASNDYDLLANILCEMSRDANEASATEALALFEQSQRAAAKVALLSPNARARCARAEALMLENDVARSDAIDVLQAALGEIRAYPVRSLPAELHLLNELGNHYFRTGRLGDAKRTNTESIALLRATGRLATEGGLVTQMNDASLLGAFGLLQKENAAFSAILTMTTTDSPLSHAIKRSLAVTYIKLGQPKDALAILEPLAAEATDDVGIATLAILHLALARAYVDLGSTEKAAPLLEKADAVFSQSPERHVGYVTWLTRLRAESRWAAGDYDGAVGAIDRALVEAGYGEDRNTASRSIPILLEPAARFALETGDNERALRLAKDWQQAVAASAQDATQSAYVGRACFAQARALRALDRQREVVASFECAIESLGNGLGERHAETVTARTELESIR